eukprot:evm.model.scf_811.6 EVM.evm.TU.scf_811.6   scf_811:39394-40752(-)
MQRGQSSAQAGPRLPPAAANRSPAPADRRPRRGRDRVGRAGPCAPRAALARECPAPELEVGPAPDRRRDGAGLGVEDTPRPLGIRAGRLPRHVAIILDGNSRWSIARGRETAYGHRMGVRAMEEVVRLCLAWGIPGLTVFALSTENLSRPPGEVAALLAIIREAIDAKASELASRGVRMRFIGDVARLGPAMVSSAARAEEATKGGKDLRLTVALCYGGRRDIAGAARRLAEKVESGELSAREVGERALGEQMEASGAFGDLGPPDMLIRTSGERRLSNFLLWDLAYAELHFCEECFPDFGEAQFRAALEDYAGRERRYGGRRAGGQ